MKKQIKLTYLAHFAECSSRNFSVIVSIAVLLILGLGLPAFGAAPTVVVTDPVPTSVVAELNQVEVIFDQSVQGVEVSDLLINGVPAANLSFGVDGQFIFEFPQPATGTVVVAWSASHGITDMAVPPNAFAGGSWSYVLDPNAAFTKVRINEFLADNQNGIRDDDGSRQDWIEIYNAASTPVDLSGWYLTDNVTALRGWQFPTNTPVQIPGNGYLLVWASGKNRKTNLGALHTDFQLSRNGEFLGLVLPDGSTVVSEFAPTYPEQQSDVSYGRDRLDPGILGFYSTPTPNAANATSGVRGFASDVIYSRPSGTFESSFALSLSTASTNAAIRYIVITNSALGGASQTNVPTATSPLYTGPISVLQSCQVRARAFEPGLLPSTPKTEIYLQIGSSIRNFSSDVPICIVHNLGAGAVPSATQAGLIMLFDNAYDRASPTNAPQMASRMGFHLRGSSTINNAKSNYRVELWDEFNQDQDRPFLDMPEESDWVLYGINQFDPGLMHNTIFYWLGRQVPGQTSSRTRYVEVFRKIDNGPITTNDYFGLYLAIETPKQGKDRLDIENLEVQNTNAPSITGGYMMKIDRIGALYNWTPSAVVSPIPGIGSIGNTPAQISIEEPKFPTGTTDPRRLSQINYIRGHIGAFITNLASATYTNPVTGYAQYIDADQWVDNLIVNIIPFNVDGYRLSGYFYKDRSDRMKQGPLWDCDRCLGTGGTTTPNADNRCFSPLFWRLPASDVGTDNGTDFFGVSNVGVNWFRPLFRDPEFWQKFIDRYQALRTNQFTTNAIVAMVDGYYKEIKEAQVREQARWGATANFTWPRSGSQTVNGYTFDFGPADNFSRGRFTNEVNFQKKWLLDRLNFMDTNFVAMPRISRGGGQVPAGTTVTVLPAAKPGSVLYYTLDGTDPRLPGGAISPSAVVMAGPLDLVINNNVRLFARSYNSSHSNMVNRGNEVGKPLINSFWSGPVAFTYYTALPTLRITELMYHPENPPSGNTNDPDNFEYVEVRNTGGAPLNVSGFRLSGGVDFLFPNQTLAAGQYAVIVRDVAAFQARYGASATILGSYTNNLGNNGDHLVLEGRLREPILDFNYADNWYPLTDGAGFALQIVNDAATNTSWGLKESWRPSGIVGGTPGVGDSGPATIAAVYINEALTHTDPTPGDAIELHNSTGNPVNVGDWYLTDDFGQPKKYRIPNPTTIPANGYVVFYQSNSFGVGAAGFALSSKGDDLYLFSGNASGLLTGWFHGFDFGAQANGPTFGRFVISTGADHFPTQTSPTLGAVNSGPQIGPIVISEVNYQPPDFIYPRGIAPNFIDEYIELHNLSNAAVPLYDPANPMNTWKLRDAVDFVFPPGVTVPASGYVLVVSFNPADTVALQQFITVNGVAAGTAIHGPWSGVLDNAGDSVELARPDLPDPPGTPTAGFVPYILADKVNYEIADPWPTGGGLGASLQRINVGAYGNDPANWRFIVTSPGTPLPTGTPVVITQQPQNTTVLETRTALFTIAVTGTAPIRYQWHFNGQPINGANSTTLVLDNVRLDQAGPYGCYALNAGGVVSSSLATLTVLPAATIADPPRDISVRIRPDLQSAPTTNATFSIQVLSQNPPVSYQWRFNGQNIPGATANSYTVVDVKTNHFGAYSVAITDANGTIFSQSATLYPLITPVYTVQPINMTNVPAGSLVSFSAQFTGFPPPFTNTWRLAATPLTNYVSDALVSTFTFRAPSTPDTTNSRYNLIIQNRAFAQPGIRTAEVNLVTVADTDGDGISDSIEVALGLNPNSAADGNADMDSDGMSNRAEVIAGTDPQNPNSYLKADESTSPGIINIAFRAIAIRTYTIQYTDDLSSGVWRKLSDVAAQTTDRDIIITDSTSRPGRLYRISTPAQ